MIPLSTYTRKRILSLTEKLGEEAFRTLSFAFDNRQVELPPKGSEVEEGLIYLGALAMDDPPRPEVFQALETCREAQVKVAMITGDHKSTALAVGRELGLYGPGKRFLTGKELEEISDEELAAEVEDISVYARVSPRHKVKIVKALKAQKHVVAMTGDGVNDAPALKSADIGVAMGITGTDVAKEASDMVLVDDNFTTIVSAIREGRIIFSNLKKFVYFLLSCNISEVLTMFVAMLAGFPLPVLPSQLLWINLVTDGLPALALGREPAEKDVMANPPRKQGENILSGRKQTRLFWQGLLMTAGALTAFFLSHYLLGYAWTGTDMEKIRAIVFTTMVFTQVFHSFNWRYERSTFLKSSPWENRYLFGAFLISLALQMAVLYVPFLQSAFYTHGPSLAEWALILSCSLVTVLAIDRLKWLGTKVMAVKVGAAA